MSGGPAPPWLAEVGERLGREIGLRVDAATEARLAQAVTARARALGRQPATYPAALVDPAERQALVDAFAVPETSFFRDAAQFEALARHVLPGLEVPVLVWSAGCSTGQEAYSLAMTLDETVGSGWRVLATDVSTPALDRARAGRYGADELKGLPPGHRARYLRKEGAAWVVDERLRQRVTVARHNLAEPALPVSPGSCSVVFCRNVLIYFRPDQARGLLDRLHDAIAPGGWLFVGASEPLWPVTDRFEPVRFGEVFAYRRPAPRRAVAARAVAAVPRRPVAAIPPARPSAAELLAAGEEAHRRGDLDRAAAHFRRAAALDPDNPLAHLRLGLVLEAQGDGPGGREAFVAARTALDRCDRPGLEAALEGWRADEITRLLADKLGER